MKITGIFLTLILAALLCGVILRSFSSVNAQNSTINLHFKTRV